MSSDSFTLIKEYLLGGYREGFGVRNPFESYSGDGGVDGLAKALAVNVKAVNCPDEDNRFSAMLFGRLLAESEISAKDHLLVQMFMEIAYEEHVTGFNKGIAMVKALARAEAASEVTGAHGGKIPSAAEALQILELKGMSWQNVVACTAVLATGTVPTLAEVELEGYGSSPDQWSSAKEARKMGRSSMTTYLKAKDAEGYRNMLLKGAHRMASNPVYGTAAAQLMLFISKLSKMTFDQGMPHLFLTYCEEHVETHKGQGLASASNPLDAGVLTETVLAEKNKARDTDSKMEKVLEQMEQQNMSLTNSLKSRMGEVNALASKVAQLEKSMSNGTIGGGKPPSNDNSCSYCRSPDHFICDCPKKAENDERRKKDLAASGASI